MSSTVSPSESIGLFTFHVVVASLSPGDPIPIFIATSTFAMNLLVLGMVLSQPIHLVKHIQISLDHRA
jgi:hypothetical protein